MIKIRGKQFLGEYVLSTRHELNEAKLEALEQKGYKLQYQYRAGMEVTIIWVKDTKVSGSHVELAIIDEISGDIYINIHFHPRRAENGLGQFVTLHRSLFKFNVNHDTHGIVFGSDDLMEAIAFMQGVNVENVKPETCSIEYKGNTAAILPLDPTNNYHILLEVKDSEIKTTDS